ncbi:MAG: hypothetical protein K6F55_03165 [Eubacterium sp.]|nr:hypothetical protein [Eubacterium sp.]
MDKKSIGLTKSYINVNGSFGGNQGWFASDKSNSTWKERAINGYGCGLVGAADVLLYILGNAAIPAGTTLNKREDYMAYLNRLEKKYFHIFPKLGLSGILLSLGLNLYFLIHRRQIKKETGCTYRARWAVRPSKLLDRIKEMLGNDIPVIISIGPGFFRKQKVKFYNCEEKDGKLKFKPVTQTKDHYVTITGILETENVTMLEISSWGKKYYVNWEEYKRYVRKYDNYYFSNILYIKKK